MNLTDVPQPAVNIYKFVRVGETFYLDETAVRHDKILPAGLKADDAGFIGSVTETSVSIGGESATLGVGRDAKIRDVTLEIASQILGPNINVSKM